VCAFVSEASERTSLPRSEFRRVIAVERYASLFSSAYVCVKKCIARTDVEGRAKVRSRSVGFCDEQREANARVSGRGGDKLTTGVQE
jgi:hypothetical protein